MSRTHFKIVTLEEALSSSDHVIVVSAKPLKEEKRSVDEGDRKVEIPFRQYKIIEVLKTLVKSKFPLPLGVKSKETILESGKEIWIYSMQEKQQAYLARLYTEKGISKSPQYEVFEESLLPKSREQEKIIILPDFTYESDVFVTQYGPSEVSISFKEKVRELLKDK